MPGACCLAWMFTVLGAGQTTDLAAGADLGASAGLISVEPNASSVPGVNSTATLLSGIRIRSARTSFIASYRPQFFYQIPNVADVNRPLVLHRAAATLATRLSARSSLGWSATGAIGDLSYSNLVRSFDQGTSAVASGVVPILLATTSGNFQHQTSPQNSVSIAGNASVRTSFDSDSQQSSTVPPSLDWTLQVSDTYALSLRDRVGASLGTTYVYRPPSDASVGTSFQDSLNVAFNANWQRNLSRRSDLSVRVGGAVSKSEVTGDFSGFPTATVSHGFRARSFGSFWTSSLSTGLQGALDPLLATYRPNAFFSWMLTGRHSEAWSSNAGLNFAVPVAKPLVPSQYETNASVVLGLNYLTPSGLMLRGGLSSSLRTAHPATIDALTPTFEATGFLGVRYTFGTGQANGTWL